VEVWGGVVGFLGGSGGVAALAEGGWEGLAGGVVGCVV